MECENPETYTYLVLPVVRLTCEGRELFRLHRPSVKPEFDAASELATHPFTLRIDSLT
jgi:hypothetical protein